MKKMPRAKTAASLILCAVAMSCVCFSQATPGVKLTPHTVRLKGKSPFSLMLPADFTIAPAAEGLKRVRFMARSPDGRIFVTTMHDLSDNSEGAVYILDGFDEGPGKFAGVIPYLTKLYKQKNLACYKQAQGQ